MGRGGAKYAIVAVDYFTKWVEAEPLTKVSSAKVINFLIRNVFCRYGVPQKIISDNGLQFGSEEFANWCQEYGIAKSFSAIAYLQANGQVEEVNKVLKTLIKKKLEKFRGHGWTSYQRHSRHIALPTKQQLGTPCFLWHTGPKQCCQLKMLYHLTGGSITTPNRMKCSLIYHSI